MNSIGRIFWAVAVIWGCEARIADTKVYVATPVITNPASLTINDNGILDRAAIIAAAT
ncbi:hypothetical protein ATG_18720 [Desulfurococcaceae archaeon AG1]|nr:hypothetical protein ATG_18720 [Desulfurococcaceae archaeon AG1]